MELMIKKRKRKTTVKHHFAATSLAKIKSQYQELIMTWNNTALILHWGNFGVTILENSFIYKVEYILTPLALNNSITRYQLTYLEQCFSKFDVRMILLTMQIRIQWVWDRTPKFCTYNKFLEDVHVTSLKDHT